MVVHRETFLILLSTGVTNLDKILLTFVVSVITPNLLRSVKKEPGMSEQLILPWLVFYTLEIRRRWKIF